MTPPFTERETFTAMLAAQPRLPGDAIVLLTGDGLSRVPTACDLIALYHAAPTMIVSGGVDAPPYALHARELRAACIERGIAPTRVIAETGSQNTAESARACVAFAREEGHARILLVTSAYHMPRAVLSFVAALGPAGFEWMRIVPIPVVQPWFDAEQRHHRLADEAAKVARYQASGDVASYADGIAYLDHWERAT